MYRSLNCHGLFPLLHQLGRIGDESRDRGSRRHIGAGEINLTVHVAHPANEIAVGGGDRPLPGGENPHMPAQAGPAGGGGDHGPRLHENIEQSLMQAVQPDLLGGGNDDAPHPVGHLPAAQHLGGGPHVLHPAVGAGADDHLVDLHLAAVVHGFCVFGQMGEGNGGAQSGEVDRDSILILRVGIGLEYPRFPLKRSRTYAPWSHRLPGRCRF